MLPSLLLLFVFSFVLVVLMHVPGLLLLKERERVRVNGWQGLQRGV